MATTDNLQARINEALDAAIFEGFYTELATQDPLSVAVDLCTYCSYLERSDVEAVKACVADYQTWYAGRQDDRPRSEVR